MVITIIIRFNDSLWHSVPTNAWWAYKRRVLSVSETSLQMLWMVGTFERRRCFVQSNDTYKILNNAVIELSIYIERSKTQVKYKFISPGPTSWAPCTHQFTIQRSKSGKLRTPLSPAHVQQHRVEVRANIDYALLGVIWWARSGSHIPVRQRRF